MALLPNERVQEAKQNMSELISYLNATGAQVQRVGQDEYTLKDMDSLRINTQKNCWIRNSTGQRGNPVEFLVQFEGMSFRDAVKALTPTWNENENVNVRVAKAMNRPQTVPPIQNANKKENENDVYTLSANAPRAIAYLTKTRGISAETVFKLIKQGRLAQDTKGNAIFRILDENKNWKGAEIVGTNTSTRFKKSTPETGYGWSMHVGTPKKLCIFESAIDAISFYELHKSHINDTALVSLAGVTKDMTFIESVKRYAMQYGIDNSNVCLCVDRDDAGDKFLLKYKPEMGCKSYRSPEPYKDWNEMLQDGARQVSKSNENVKSNQKEEISIKHEEMER